MCSSSSYGEHLRSASQLSKSELLSAPGVRELSSVRIRLKLVVGRCFGRSFFFRVSHLKFDAFKREYLKESILKRVS